MIEWDVYRVPSCVGWCRVAAAMRLRQGEAQNHASRVSSLILYSEDMPALNTRP